MKVLKSADKTWTKKVTCGGCKAVLEIEASDLRKVIDNRDGNYAMCECPECRHLLTWAQSLIPRAVWETLRER